MDRNRGHKDLGPPPRWLYCPRKGSPIVEKFIPFKTPLDERYDSQVPEECTFTPAMLIASMSSYKMKLGLWIDLTNTTRFYDKKEVEERKISYIKLQCRGHGECPSEEQTNMFIEICQRFISKNPLQVIGVHCTHGYNRTGFLIVSYLIESLSWSVEAALHSFSQARPPGIYKQDYLNELFKRYGDISDVLSAPPLPEWCNAVHHHLVLYDTGWKLQRYNQKRYGTASYCTKNLTCLITLGYLVLPVQLQPYFLTKGTSV